MAAPGSAAEAAATLAAAAAQGRSVRVVGGGTKLAWAPAEADVELSTAALAPPVEHNEGDLTAVLGAGVTLAAAQERFAAAGQMLALDPPDGDGRATIGGIVATNDSGPLRHRYGAPRDLVLGVQVALSDGTVARAGSRVIKNVAGYDLAKLLAGSRGTLGVICEVIVRLHPVPAQTATVRGIADDAATLAAAARALARAPLELEALDLAWSGGRGGLLARVAGRAAEARAQDVVEHMSAAGLDADLAADAEEAWRGQRARQRGELVVKVSGLPSRWEDVLGGEGEVVGRAALGLAWVRLPAGDLDAVARLRERVAPCACTVLDGPPEAHEPWPPGPEAAVMRRVKARFDPAGALTGGPA